MAGSGQSARSSDGYTAVNGDADDRVGTAVQRKHLHELDEFTGAIAGEPPVSVLPGSIGSQTKEPNQQIRHS